MKKTKGLRGKIKQAAERAEDQNNEDMGSWEHFKELLVEEIVQACNQWLEEQGAQHKVKCSHCSWSQFTSEVAGMSPCYECNSTGYIFEPLRLEIDA